MTGNYRRRFSNFFGFVITALAIAWAISSFALQEKISPLSDYQYKRDYARYEEIKKETDPQKRADLLLAFVKERPISKILMYVASDYVECLKSYMEKKDWAKVTAMQEAFWAAIPDEKTVQEAGIPVGTEEFIKDQLRPTQKLILTALTAAYYQANNFAKAAEAAEKGYQITQDKSMLPALADIYLKIPDTDKYLAIGQKILSESSIEQSYSMALQMAQVYIQKQDLKSAADLLGKVMDVYGDKVPPNVQESAWNATRAFAYGVMASAVYASKDYAKALELYQKVVKFDPKREDAYYFIGMCKWQNKDQQGAVEAFARSVVLNKTYAERARKYMEDLYKALHNGSLDGLDEVLAKAKSELGIS